MLSRSPKTPAPGVVLAAALSLSCVSATRAQIDVDVAVRRTGGVRVAVPGQTRSPAPARATNVPSARAATAPSAVAPVVTCDAPVAEVALGPRRSCTRHTDGRVCCWGAGHGGVPARVEGVANATHLSLGGARGCAAQADGSVVCWSGAAASAVPGLGDVDLIGAGPRQVCARVRGDGVRCWGDRVAVPTRVEGVDDVASFSVGVDPCVVTSARGLHCWGDGLLYTYRHADPWAGLYRHYTLRALRDVRTVSVGWREHAAGDAFVCAVTGDRRLWCWGGMFDGSHDRETGATTGRMTPVNVAGVSDAVTVAAGGAHACVIRGNAKLWCWGDNAHGQLGDGTRVHRNVPVEVRGIGEVTAVAASEGHTCAQARDGSLWCWGRNRDGELGDGSAEDRDLPVRVRQAPSG